MHDKKISIIKNIWFLFATVLTLVSCGGGGSGGSSNNSGQQGTSASEYYKDISNTVVSADMGNNQILVSFANYKINSGQPATQYFQIGVSNNNGQTYELLVPSSTDVSSIIPTGTSAYPTSIIYSDSTILLSVTYSTSSASSSTGVFIIDRNTLTINFVPTDQTGCVPASGLQQNDGSWLLAGSCNGDAAIFHADANLGNINILDKLTSNSYGGSYDSIISASDSCLYVGGYNWQSTNNQKATHIVIARSCDAGSTWTSDLDYYNAGQAYTGLVRLYEFNGQIQFYGDIGEADSSGTITNVTAVTAQRMGANNWSINKMPGTTVSDSTPSSYIAFEDGTCNMVSTSLLSGFVTYYSLSTDCGVTWSAPVATTYGRITDLTLKNGVITFYNYDSEFHENQLNFNTALSNVP